MGALTVTIELVWEDAERGYRRLRTNCVAESELPSMKPLLNVVRLPLGVASEEPASFGMAPIPAPAPSVHEGVQSIPRARAAPAPAAPGAQRSIFASGGFKIAAMAFVVITAGTFFFQNSSSTAPKPAAGAPTASREIPSIALAEPAELAATAEEFRKASEPFSENVNWPILRPPP